MQAFFGVVKMASSSIVVLAAQLELTQNHQVGYWKGSTWHASFIRVVSSEQGPQGSRLELTRKGHWGC